MVGFIGVASTMSANVLDRTKEFGILHAIGARPATVRRTVATEGVLLAVAGTLVAIPLALVLAAVLGAGLGDLFLSAPLPYRFSPTAMAAWLAVAVVGAVLATDAAATRAARTTVREALADTG
ncbi:FtsX-like permease family protein [Actinokineospora soli]|uniref:FtsX-like permease family protein n=1 Tax=Actinokineospora soli TaxID=1048753 RepID=A0ABW2TNE8_9PSEU